MASVDDIATNTAFAQKNAASFPVLSDPDKSVAEAYGVLVDAGYSARRTYYIDPTGRIVYIDTAVSALSAGTDMLNIINGLGY